MEHVRSAFDRVAREYDAQREHVIPCLRELYGTAIWAMELNVESPRVLDLGAGTGLLSALVLERYPAARMTLMDISEGMLEIARKRFEGKSNVSFRVGDYSASELGGPWELVCSALSIHHLHAEEKRRLFERIHSALAPGGLFVNLDQAEGETPFFQRMYREYWDAYVRSGPLSREEREEIERRRETLDRNERLSTQLRWLQEAGFADIDVVYRNRTFIITVARKKEERKE